MLKLVILVSVVLGVVGLAIAGPRPRARTDNYQLQQQARRGPRQSGNDVTILRSNNVHNDDGSFSYDFETSDGTRVEQSGYLKNPGTEQEGIAIQGQFYYVDPEGQTTHLKYTADDQGFLPEGAHLPTSPPIPDAIKKSLEIIYRAAGDQMRRERSRH